MAIGSTSYCEGRILAALARSVKALYEIFGREDGEVYEFHSHLKFRGWRPLLPGLRLLTVAKILLVDRKSQYRYQKPARGNAQELHFSYIPCRWFALIS